VPAANVAWPVAEHLVEEAEMALFLFIVLIAVVLGIIGAAVNGLLYLLVIGVVVFLVGMLFGGWRLRGGRRHVTR
jgi:1,4-dihydroxy-2-naphthoate octaprenyltransferase